MSLHRAWFRHTVETTFGTFERNLREHFRYAVVHHGCVGGDDDRDGHGPSPGCYGFARDLEKAEHLVKLAGRKSYVGVQIVPVTAVRKVAADPEPRRLPDRSIREP